MITRPEPGASETAARVAALGYRPVVAPLLEISILHATLPPSAHLQAILATSGSAIPALPVSHRHLPLFAVGEATAERALLARLDGSCRTPIGGYARLLPNGELHLTGLVARGDGSFLLKRSLHGAAADAERIGADLGASLRADSPRDIFA